jgi:hypothetical protein
MPRMPLADECERSPLRRLRVQICTRFAITPCADRSKRELDRTHARCRSWIAGCVDRPLSQYISARGLLNREGYPVNNTQALDPARRGQPFRSMRVAATFAAYLALRFPGWIVKQQGRVLTAKVLELLRGGAPMRQVAS